MRERADRMDGVLIIVSHKEVGTSVCVTVHPRAGGEFVAVDNGKQVKLTA
jgi:nitrate/nitrite-specific signal transduction histidine kinase